MSITGFINQLFYKKTHSVPLEISSLIYISGLRRILNYSSLNIMEIRNVDVYSIRDKV